MTTTNNPSTPFFIELLCKKYTKVHLVASDNDMQNDTYSEQVIGSTIVASRFITRSEDAENNEVG